jgi:hypothetical protein
MLGVDPRPNEVHFRVTAELCKSDGVTELTSVQEARSISRTAEHHPKAASFDSVEI